MLRDLPHTLLVVSGLDLATGLVCMQTERLFPSLPAQRRFRPGMIVDLAYSYLAALVAAATAAVGFDAAINRLGAHPALASMQHHVAGLSFVVGLLVATVITDFTGYWKHRLLHTRFLWPFHAVHHSSEEVDWLSNERFHPVEMFFTTSFFIVPLVVLGFPGHVIAWTTQIRRLHSIYEHTNTKIDYGRVHHVLVSPMLHRWHHSSHPEWVDTNYANIFALFDWVFGTLKVPTEAPPAGGFGVTGYPRDFWRQLWRPFRDGIDLLRGHGAA